MLLLFELFIGHFLLRGCAEGVFFIICLWEYVGSFERGQDYSIGEIAEIFFGFWGRKNRFSYLAAEKSFCFIILKNLIRFFLRCIIM